MIREKVKYKTENNLQIIGRNLLLVLLSTIIGILTVNWLASFLPQYYESTSVLSYSPPANEIENFNKEDFENRVKAFNAEILSRSSLEPLVKKYKIGNKENLPIEIRAMIMRHRIKVQPEESGKDKVFGFSISYRDENPETARNVVQELSIKYINFQTLYEINRSEKTQEFRDKQLEDIKLELDKIEEERLGIMYETANHSSDTCNSSINQLDGLRRKEKGISEEKQDLFNEKGRLNHQISSINGQINLIEKFLQSNSKNENDLQLLEGEKKKLEKQILKIDQKIKQKESELNKTNVEITKVELKINSIPNFKDALENINNEYYKVKSQYDELLKKRDEVQLTYCRGECGQSNRFQIKVIDPANLPKYAVSPNRWQVIGIGAGLGFLLGIGLLLAVRLKMRFSKFDLR